MNVIQFPARPDPEDDLHFKTLRALAPTAGAIYVIRPNTPTRAPGSITLTGATADELTKVREWLAQRDFPQDWTVNA